jgi:hypothetical protein
VTDPSDAVEAYLAERFKVGLEQVLLDASIGRVTPTLDGTVAVTCRERGRFAYADRGSAFHYEGEITVQGVAYRFRTWIFQDLDGRRIMTDLSEFASEGWSASIRMGDARA